MDFEQLYEEYWAKIFRLCRGYVKDYNLAQDMTQETFIRAWKYSHSFKNEANIGTWIFRIATNVCLRSLEREKIIIPTELSEYSVSLEEDDIEPQIQLLYECIAELPEIDRIIISLELEDVKQSAIAEIVGLSESNIRVRIHRIKTVLKKKMKEYGE